MDHNIHDFIEPRLLLSVVVYTFNSNTEEAEAGGSLSLRPAWSSEFQESQGYVETDPVSFKKKKISLLSLTCELLNRWKVKSSNPTEISALFTVAVCSPYVFMQTET